MNKIPNTFVNQTIEINNMPLPTIGAYLGETYAQCYEDIIMESLIRVHGINSNAVYVEIGANHPVCTSPSYLFEIKYNMSGILVEANPKLVPALHKFRKNVKIINAAIVDNDSTTVEFYVSRNNETSSLDSKFVDIRTPGLEEKIVVRAMRINDILKMTDGSDIAMLTIDVEGYDLHLIKDMDFNKYRPRLIQIEPSEDYSPGSTSQIISYLVSNNYTLVGVTDVNLIFSKN